MAKEIVLIVKMQDKGHMLFRSKGGLSTTSGKQCEGIGNGRQRIFFFK